ncbi:MAG: cytidylate kinase-like family protein [Clostridiales Family XIII bacterium]|jgi:cytidylate kinase|nr:cytidylate kinase-like family protein [Clostridiales Family XIII bacterium]
MSTHVITVARQFGSLGRPIAEQLAQRLGFEYIDRDIIEKAAEDLGKPVYELMEIDDRNKTPKYMRMMYPLGVGRGEKQDKLFEIERDIIIDLAKSKDCVIVGRCADFILTEAGFRDLYNIFVYASYHDRFNYCLSHLGFNYDAVEKHIKRVDSERSSYYTHYTGERFDSPKYRDLMINSGSMTFDRIVESLTACAKLRFQL